MQALSVTTTENWSACLGHYRRRGDAPYKKHYAYVPNGSQTDLLASYQNGSDTVYTYTYDENGNITSISQGGSTTYYTYDRLNELIREDNATLNQSWTYTYDVNGNLLNKKRYAYVPNGGALGACLETISYGYEAAYQDWEDQLTSYNGEAIRYDDSGNPISYRGYTMAWQGRRLTSATKTGTAISYSYDENGIRTQKTVNGVSTNYYYNGSVLMSLTQGDTSLLFSYDAAGNVVAVEVQSDSWLIDGETLYYIRNGQGDITGLINSSGRAVIEYRYDTWGRDCDLLPEYQEYLELQELNPFRYRGYVYDTETGWYYLQSRYYDPEVGRFLSADVLLSTGQGVLGHNMFAYCLNNPVNGSDPSGKAGNIYRTWVETYTGRNAPIKGLERKPDKYYLQDIFYDPSYKTISFSTLISNEGNCYQYATGATYEWMGKGCYFPGYVSRYSVDYRFNDAQHLAECIQRDLNACYRREGRSFVVTPCESDYMPPEGAWKVAYCYGGGDFHFLRYDVDIGWTHKPGFDGSPTSNDFSGNRIYDLYEADLGQYNEDTLLFLMIKEVTP